MSPEPVPATWFHGSDVLGSAARPARTTAPSWGAVVACGLACGVACSVACVGDTYGVTMRAW